MKKIFTLIAAALMAATVFADNVLFKMVAATRTIVSVPAKAGDVNGVVSLDSYAVVAGGTAEVGNKGESAQNAITTQNGWGMVRLTSKDIYLHITLPRALKSGDKILYTDEGEGSHHTIFLTKDPSRAKWSNDQNVTYYNEITAGTEYIVTESRFIGATDLYFWQGNHAQAVYISTLTIIGDEDETVRYYDFHDEAVRTFAVGETKLFDDELSVNNDEAGNDGNGVKKYSANALYLRGRGENRALSFDVTDPCTIEVWGRRAANAERTLYLSEGTYSGSGATAITGLSGLSDDLLYKGTYNFEGLTDSTRLFIDASGSFYVYAIRVKYAKIRPAADLAIDPEELTVKVGETKNFTITTSSNAKITRGKRIEAGEGDLVKLNGVDAEKNLNEPAATINGSVEGKAVGTYVMTLTQEATADYRKGYAELTITVEAADSPTAIDDVKEVNKAVKMMENGQVVILRDGVKYNVLGTRL